MGHLVMGAGVGVGLTIPDPADSTVAMPTEPSSAAEPVGDAIPTMLDEAELN